MHVMNAEGKACVGVEILVTSAYNTLVTLKGTVARIPPSIHNERKPQLLISKRRSVTSTFLTRRLTSSAR
jgi:hypothetical protein